MPLISVVIPTFNRALLLREAIDSALAQEGFSDFEVIVVDDGSSDGSRALIESYGDRVRGLFQANSGLGASRNAGIALARGDYVALLDDDDRWFTWTLATYARAIDEHARPWLISAGLVDFDNGAAVPEPNHDRYRSEGFRDFFASAGTSYWAAPSACCFKAEIARAHEGFFTMNTGHEENDLWLRAGTEAGFVKIVEPPCAARRVHGSNLSGYSDRNLRGTHYLLAQERNGAYPGGRERRPERLSILLSHIRPVSRGCLAEGRWRDGWELYRATFAGHVAGRRWKYLLGWPALALVGFARRLVSAREI